MPPYRTAFPLAVLALFTLTPSVARPLAGQDESAATRERAISHLQRQEYEEAVEILQAAVERSPDDAQAWSLLGYALHSAGRLEPAIAAYLKATEFEATAPTAMYNLGLAYGQMGEPDAAFEWLYKARDTRQVDMTRIHFDPDAENLRGDPRYGALFPDPAELVDPFVEPVEIIREWTGEAAGDQFGWIARDIADIDGDGVHDVATSAPFKRVDGDNAGKIYVFSSGTGELLWSRAGRAGERLGLGIEAAGDVNHDDVPDVIAGAPGGDRTYVYSGRDGTVLMTLYARQEDELFGRKVSDLGDIDGDRHDDVLVGAPQNDADGEDAGRAYVFSGETGMVLLTLRGEEPGDAFGSSVAGLHRDGHTLIVVGAPNAGPGDRGRTYVYKDLSGAPAFVIDPDESGAMLGGMFVSVVGDVDADGVPDIYASDWSDNAKGRVTGRIYVHSGADGSRLLTLSGEAAGDGFGIGSAEAGDVDDDGHDDLIIGAWQHSGAAPGGGKAYLFSGDDGAVLRSYTGRVSGETFGFDATGIGDVDGDDTIDFLLTSAWSSIRGPRSGRVYIISGAAATDAPRPD